MNVEEMEATIRVALNEPSQAKITSANVLNAINDGYKDVSFKAFCVEDEIETATTTGSRLVSAEGSHRVNFVVLESA